MNLIDESREVNKSNKKVFVICGVSIAVLLIIIIGLVIATTVMKSNKKSLVIDGKNAEYSNYILEKENVLYIGIEDLTKLTINGYNYKSGSKDVEDENKCYITNTYESTFFEVGSNEIFKVLEDTNETEYYTLQNPIIKENNKIYLPLNAVKTAFNSNCTIENNKVKISSIVHMESVYNQQQSATFVPDASILWETTYSNKKLLKNNLVIIKDETEKLGVAKVTASTQTNNKVKVTKVQTQHIITPKYKDIKYIESFNQLIVETENGKGIIQLEEENGNYKVETAIVPQYEDIKQINEDLFLVSEGTVNPKENEMDETAVSNVKYGIVNKQGDTILPIEYQKIGIDISNFTNNDLNSEYIIYNKYIPVKKGNLWGFIDLNGTVTINLQYDDLGCIGSNPSSNVLIIPELEAIVVKKDEKYGIIKNTGKVLMRNVLTKVYKENLQGKEVYSMVYVGKKLNAVEYINNLNSSTNNNNTTNNNTNKTNSTKNTTTNKTNNETNKTENKVVVKKNTSAE